MEKKLEAKMIELNNHRKQYIQSQLQSRDNIPDIAIAIEELNDMWMIQQIAVLQLQMEAVTEYIASTSNYKTIIG